MKISTMFYWSILYKKVYLNLEEKYISSVLMHIVYIIYFIYLVI